MRKSTIVVLIIGVILTGSLFTCLGALAIGPRIYEVWWRSFEIVDHDFPLQQKWCFEADGNIRSTPVEYNNRIVIRTNQLLYALDATTGEPVWWVALPKTWIATPPIIRSDTVVVIHTKGSSAFDLASGEQLWFATDSTSRPTTYPPVANEHIVVIVGSFVEGRDIRTGELLWRINRLYPRTGAIAAVDQSYLYLVFDDQIRTYDIETGELVQIDQTEEWTLRSWLYQDGIWYLEHENGGLSAFSLQERKILWRDKNLGRIDYPMAKYGDVLLLGLWDSWPVARDASTGDILWEAKGVISDTYQTPLVVGDRVYVRGLSKKRLYALDLATGNVIGYLETGRPVLASSNADNSLGPIQVGRSIVFAGDHRLCSYE